MLQIINPVALELGPISIRWYGVIIAAAIYLATILSDKEAQKRGFRSEFITDFLLWMLPISFIGARLYYVVFEWEYYISRPLEIIAIWEGGIAIYGGLIAGGLAALWFCKKEGVSVFYLLDIITPTVLLAQSIGRWGNFVNQEAYGGEVTREFLQQLFLPDVMIEQMNINGVYVHPTFLYESVWSFIGVLLLMYLRRKPKFLKLGETTALYVAWYAFGRFFIEGMRTDSLMLFDVIRISQALSAVLFVGAIIFIWRRRQYGNLLPYYSDGNPLRKEGKK